MSPSAIHQHHTWGHEGGDAALVELAGILRRPIRSWDLAVRLAGDDFALVIVLEDEATGLAVERSIRAEVGAARIRIGDSEIQVTVSAGVHEQIDIADIDEAIRLADLALHEAKKAARNRVAPSQYGCVPQSPG